MLLALGVALALQGTVQIGPPPRGRRPPSVVRDSSGDSTRRNAPRRLPVTAEALRTAFHDNATRELFTLARRARVTQDSSIRSYDAKAVQRASFGMGIGSQGRERLMYRQESAARVQWEAGVGAWIDLTGARVAAPAFSGENDGMLRSELTSAEMSPIPYFPGYESLWLGGFDGTESAAVDVNDRSLVNPLGEGAEAYYTYTAGDSTLISLPDGFSVHIREMEFRPRSPKWNLAVGTLWFDTRNGQLVRAAYRLSMVIDIWTAVADNASDRGGDDVPGAVSAIFSPVQMQVSAIATEYVLCEGRFWMPRMRIMQGTGQVLFAHVPIQIETSFQYESVNRPLNLPPIQIDFNPGRMVPPGMGVEQRRAWLDSVARVRAAQTRAIEDSVRQGLRAPAPNSRSSRLLQCERSDIYIRTAMRYDVRLRVGMRIPCDLEKLRNSPDLPPSIYEPGEKVFGSGARDELLAAAVKFGAQAPIKLGQLVKPDIKYGAQMTRFNRVEGFSTGVLVEQQLGGGYAASALARFGFSDLQPNAELSISRTNLSKTIHVTGYNRLVTAGDWGNPLSFGSSVAGFLFGRDEGFYYRASGGEVRWTSDRGVRLNWRVFGEQQRTAIPRNGFSLGPEFIPNIVAAKGIVAGAGARYIGSYGANPAGFRLFTDVRAEGAGGDSLYGRGAIDLTMTRGLGRKAAASLTVAVGSSVGQLPAQRRWYLGGTQTVRGQRPDTSQNGTAFWLGRAELARGQPVFRTALFGDIGWTGDRTKISEVIRPMSGVGIGWSILDGVFRFDLACGLYPTKRPRVDFYLDARF